MAINISLWISLVIAVVFVIKTNYPTSKARSMKEIIDKPDFIKIENFCSTEENVKCPQNEKTSHRMGENIFKRHI